MSGETGFTVGSERKQIEVRAPEGEAGKFYIVPVNLMEQLAARQSIRRTVESFWQEQGWGLPPIPLNQPLGILPRQVATARFEDLYFMTLCGQAGLVPCWLELIKDKFVSKSSYKVGLLSPHLFDGLGRSGGPKLRKVVLAKGPECEGKPLSHIMTQEGISLIDWHHKFRKSFFNGHWLTLQTGFWLGAGRASITLLI